MKIYEQIETITKELISKNGVGYEISTREFKALVNARFGTKLDSIIPPDYCYNRVNKGITFFKYPRLFAYVGRGVYKCLGTNYLYNGPVYAKPQGSKTEFVVGTWRNGIFSQNANWESCCLK